MLRIDKASKSFHSLERKTLKDAGYWERRDLQKMIRQAPKEFCRELGEKICFVGEEIAPTDVVSDRVDLLGIDPDGIAVIVEIKRDSHKLHLLQALSYAGMVAKWEPKRFIEQLCAFNKKGQEAFEQAKEELEEFLEDGDVEALNRNQRIVLLAEEFDYEVLITAEWLTERYDVDIRCYRLALAKNGNDEFLTCTRAYPPPELTDLAVRRRRRKEIGGEEATDWGEALKSIENDAVVKFYKQELAAGRASNPKYKALRFYIGDRRRFTMNAQKKSARVWQSGRFEDDIEFWSSRLGERGNVETKRGGRRLRFYLYDDTDFGKFGTAVNTELTRIEFQGSVEDEADEEERAAE
jgi:hypothetical protein